MRLPALARIAREKKRAWDSRTADVIAATPTLQPQPGPQATFSECRADIAIFGGSAGGGKSYAALLEPLKYIDNPGFGAVIFRRTSPMITNEGGLWDDSQDIYARIPGARPYSSSPPYWRFGSGASVSFAHLQHDKDVFGWQGSQIALLIFDELTHFTERQFWYMLSRVRSSCQMTDPIDGTSRTPYVRATTNPDPDSFVAKLIEWWIDQETGYAIESRAGVIRWFIRDKDELHWADTREELVERFPESLPKSLTFIPSKLDDNPALLSKDPSYRSNIAALGHVESERLGKGNWKIRATAGTVFNRDWFHVVPDAPITPGAKWLRFWDKAATEGAGDYTVGVLMTMSDGAVTIVDIERFRHSPGPRDARMQAVKSADIARVKAAGGHYYVAQAQDPGQAGKSDVQSFVRLMSGASVFHVKETGSKVKRAEPFAAQAYHGNVALVTGAWNDEFVNEAHRFTGDEGGVDDQIDAAANAFTWLANNGGARKPQNGSPQNGGPQPKAA